MKNEVGEIRNLMQHVDHLKQEWDFPSEASKFRHNKISRESYVEFKGSPIDTKMLLSSRELSTNPLPGLYGSSGLSGRNSQQLNPVESFERSIKRDSINFRNLRKESIGMLDEEMP